MSIYDPDGGGPVERPGNLVLTPSAPVNMGNVQVGFSGTVTFVAANTGTGDLTVDSITAPGAEWSITAAPVFPLVLGPSGSFNFTLTLTPTGVGAKATTVTAVWEDAYGGEPNVTVNASGTGIAAGTHNGAWIPSALAFPTTQVNHHVDILCTINNVGSADFNVTGLAFSTGTQFSLVGAATPFLLAAGLSHNITVRFAPIVAGNLLDTLTATTDLAGDVILNVQGIALLVVPIAICSNNDRRVVVSGYDINGLQAIPAPLITSPDSFDSEQIGAIVFNGALWEGLGVEKTLLKLGFYYENLGVATLVGTISCFRPRNGADALDLKNFSVVLGTALADGSTRYAEADAIATGEILSLTLGRNASSGAVSICAIVPYFEPRGEKVKDS